MRVHTIQAGCLAANRTFLRGTGWSALLRRREDFEFPVYVYVVEHPEGLLAIDTGMSTRGWPLRGPTPRFIPSAKIESPQEEAGPQLRAHGLKGEDVRRVVLTYLDVDHVGGIAHFPNAEFIVHPREHEFAHSFLGRQRQRPQDWPDFDPVLYDFEPEPLGPFPESKAVTEAGDLRLVPLPGHTIGQVGAILQADGSALFFAADHMLCQAWFLEDLAADRLTNIGLAARKRYAETNQRIHRFVQETPTVLLPAHDTEAAARLEAMETVKP